MSYRLYLAKRSKEDAALKNSVIPIVIDQIKSNEDYETFFPNFEFIKRYGFEQILELGDDNYAFTIRNKSNNYFTAELLDKYNDYIDNKEVKIGIVTKEMIIDYIKAIHEERINHYKRIFEESKNNSELLTYEFTKIISNKIMTWETSIDFLNDKDIPYAVTSSTEYFLLKLYNILKETNWEKEEVVIYGW